MGRRLGEFTAENTKCMLSVNGERLIDRMLRQLASLDLERIVIVTGYAGDNLRRHIERHWGDLAIELVDNPVYDRTNNIYSLWLAREYMAATDTLLLESDLIFEPAILRLALESPEPNVALVSKYESWNDGTMVTIDSDCNIVNFITKKAFDYSDVDDYYKTVNIYKFSADFARRRYLPFLDAYIKMLGENEYYEQVLRVLTLIDSSGMKALPVNGLRWYEIDDVQDLRIAEAMFATPEERLKMMQRSYGGYWRYPRLLDFCYLVNPYFPRRHMVEEMKASFDVLLRQYPSGMGVNSLLAGKYFGIRQDYVLPGNGAAELIKALMERSEGKIGVTFPTFEEYPNRLPQDRVVAYHPANPDFAYGADDLMDYFADKNISTLLVVNPDNPSGNFIPREDLLRLCARCRERRVRLVVDESFVDFASDGFAMTLLDNRILSEWSDTLVVMKSISKSYGVPGLRLGILASGDAALIAALKKEVAIWNINSFAEYYMQIFGKYQGNYVDACEKFRREREIFASELEDIEGVRVIPSQANYFLCELTSGITSHELTLWLLRDHDILIKDCSTKHGFPPGRQYVRIAVRDRADNSRLSAALREIMSNHNPS